MKKNIFVVLAAAVMLLFSACSKDKELAGTKWISHMSETQTVEGIAVTVDADITLTFNDATKYTLEMGGTASAMGMTFNLSDILNPEDLVSNGTYTFDGETGVFTDSDGEQQTFTYDKDANTISISGESVGSTVTLVFNEVN